jgi:hypothetical protein
MDVDVTKVIVLFHKYFSGITKQPCFNFLHRYKAQNCRKYPRWVILSHQQCPYFSYSFSRILPVMLGCLTSNFGPGFLLEFGL